MSTRLRPGAEYGGLKKALGALGYVRPGSLVRRYMPCGKAACRCASDPQSLHGPYYQWTTKRHGKTVTVRLTREQARVCAEWTQNHRRLKELVRRLEELSLMETDRI